MVQTDSLRLAEVGCEIIAKNTSMVDHVLKLLQVVNDKQDAQKLAKKCFLRSKGWSQRLVS